MAYRVEIARSAEADLEKRKPHVYRIFFILDELAEVVHVVHLRWGARQPATAAELKVGE